MQRDLSWLRPLRASETRTSDRFRHSASARAWYAYCHSLHVIIYMWHNIHTTQIRTNIPGHQRHPIGCPQGWVLVLCPTNFLRMSWPPERETRHKYDHSPKEVSMTIYIFDKECDRTHNKQASKEDFYLQKKGKPARISPNDNFCCS